MNMKPCPFCGSAALDVQRLNGFNNWASVHCHYCCAVGPDIRILPGEPQYEWERRAIEAWNERVTEQETDR